MNNSFVLRMAGRFAARVKAEVGTDTSLQVSRVFQYAYGREPHPSELPDCVALAQQEGLSALCRVVFNSNEFLYVD
jgi:hypothetical protein